LIRHKLYPQDEHSLKKIYLEKKNEYGRQFMGFLTKIGPTSEEHLPSHGFN
jgi:hypothetical protein